MAADKEKTTVEGLFDSLVKISGQVAGSTRDLARNTATMTAMFGDNWLSTSLLKTMEPERLEAMAEAGKFLRDARETAGLSLKDLAEGLGLADNEVLRDVESGETILPLELMLRAASLLARHDPIPFLIKFMRTYNPSLGKTLEQWGILALPKNYERERRFVNLYRQHDALRGLSDEEYLRFNEYMDSSISLVLDVMLKEKAAAAADTPTPDSDTAKKARPKRPRKKTTAKAKTRRRTSAPKSAPSRKTTP
jgi:transcriptional regulator with XRE-family HTH domain